MSDIARPHGGSGLAIAVALALGPALTAGFARFAYGLLVPAMQADLGWTNTEAGLAGSANAFGYLLGAVLAPRLIRALGDRRAYIGGAVLTTFATFATGLVGDFGPMLLIRFLPGLTGAMVFIAGALIAVRLGDRTGRRSLVLGVFYAGVGFGIAVTGGLLPFLVADAPADWRLGWYACGGLCVVAAVPAVWAVLQIPGSLRGLRKPAPFPVRRFGWAAAGYFLYAVGMIGYMTFMVAYLAEAGAGAGLVALFWVAIGLAGMPSAFVWAPLIEKTSNGTTMAATMVVLTAAAVLPLLVVTPVAAIVSALLFGSAVFATVSVTTSLVRRGSPEPAWAAGVGFFTVLFGIGQTLGPYLAGAVSDVFGGLDAGLWICAALLAIGAGVSLLQPAVNRPA